MHHTGSFCNKKSAKSVKKTVRINNGGNYCGHNPCSPNLSIKSSTTKTRPKILSELQRRLKKFYSNPECIPTLWYAQLCMSFLLNKFRQKRSERREACIQLLMAIIDHTDLVSMRCGIPSPTGFKALTLEYLIRFTNLNQRRAERAMADLKDAGLIAVHQPRQLDPNGNWIGLAGVKTLNIRIFKLFGLAQRLKFERKKAVNRLKKKLEAIKDSGVSKVLADWTRSATLITKKKGNIYLNTVKEEILRKRHDLLVHIKQQYPDKTAEEINLYVNDILLKGLIG